MSIGELDANLTKLCNTYDLSEITCSELRHKWFFSLQSDVVKEYTRSKSSRLIGMILNF